MTISTKHTATIYIDTSALFAWLDVDDRRHRSADDTWRALSEERQALVSSNYVLLETVALLGRRLGLRAVHDFHERIAPLLQPYWVDHEIHDRAMAAVLTAGRRDLSLVDCVSFEVMRRMSIDTAFAFDPHFRDQGFNTIP